MVLRGVVVREPAPCPPSPRTRAQRTNLDDEGAQQRERQRFEADVGGGREGRVLEVLLQHGEEAHGC